MAGHTLAVLKTQPILAANTDQPIVNSLHYLHEDHLNSVVMITDADGSIVEKNHYDAFGKKRLAIVDLNNAQFYAAGFLPITDRSFTGHRYLPNQELIHMKGRVYDPTFGRFLSADPHIQSPLMSQSLNRYSYVLNNPLSLTDPSGYFIEWLNKLHKKILKVVKKIIKKVIAAIKRVIQAIETMIAKFLAHFPMAIKIIAVIVIAYYSPGIAAKLGNMVMGAGTYTAATVSTVASAAVAGAAAGLIMTGSFTGAVIGAASAAAFTFVGAQFGSFANHKALGSKILESGIRFARAAFHTAQVLAHGLTGGLLAKLQGGSFSDGFKGSAIGKLVTIGTNVIFSNFGSDLNKAGQFWLVTAAGYLAGGPMGARMAALGFLFNQMNNLDAQEGNPWSDEGYRNGAGQMDAQMYENDASYGYSLDDYPPYSGAADLPLEPLFLTVGLGIGANAKAGPYGSAGVSTSTNLKFGGNSGFDLTLDYQLGGEFKNYNLGPQNSISLIDGSSSGYSYTGGHGSSSAGSSSIGGCFPIGFGACVNFEVGF